jgi:hypothetical protein
MHGAWPLTVLFLLLFATQGPAGDPRLPQLSAAFLAQPAPIVQDGLLPLCERAATNFSNSRYAWMPSKRRGQTKTTANRPVLAAMIALCLSNPGLKRVSPELGRPRALAVFPRVSL